jgi:hypothetical protein
VLSQRSDQLCLPLQNLGRFLTALNKVLADQHKRAMEARKHDKTNSPKDMSSNTPIVPFASFPSGNVGDHF